VGRDAESVTVATMHFSNFFISMIEKALLKKDIDSHFQPGIDDWQFTNRGSYISPGGHCEGQSLTAMWYYCTQPDGNGACLYGRYDNNGDKPATPELWQDDWLGYRLCSVVQQEQRFPDDATLNINLKDFWHNLGGMQWKFVNNKWGWTAVPGGIGDEAEYNLFCYSIRATGEPQEVVIWSDAGGGHSMIVYKIVGNTLYVADPNYPGNTDRQIILENGNFKPYKSGANKEEIDAGHSQDFEHIEYSGKTTVVPWDKIAKHWVEFKDRTIGKDKFPAYKIVYKDDKDTYQELKDGYISPVKLIDIREDSGGVIREEGALFFRDGKQIKPDSQGKIELNPGDNKLGIYVEGKPNNKYKFVDFKYFNVKFDDGQCNTPPPPEMLAKLQKTTRFDCGVSLPATLNESDWKGKKTPTRMTGFLVPRGNDEHTHPTSFDQVMPITWSGTTFKGDGIPGYPGKLTGNVCYSGGKLLVSFDYGINDPKNNFQMSWRNVPVESLNLMKPPAGAVPGFGMSETKASVIKPYVTRLVWSSHVETPTREGPPEVADYSLISADYSGPCAFGLEFY
jgi:hypothetical protein